MGQVVQDHIEADMTKWFAVIAESGLDTLYIYSTLHSGMIQTSLYTDMDSQDPVKKCQGSCILEAKGGLA